jgi:signal transduction histidine kinase
MEDVPAEVIAGAWGFVYALAAGLLLAVLAIALRRSQRAQVLSPSRLVIDQLNSVAHSARSIEQSFPALAETIAETAGLSYVAISLTARPGSPLFVEHGERAAAADAEHIAIEHQGRVLGELILAPRDIARRDIAPRTLALQLGLIAASLTAQAEVQVLTGRLINSREQERRRIQRELHDGLGQSLSGLMLMLGATQRQLRQHPEQIETKLQDLQAATERITDELRGILTQLHPPRLNEQDFATAVRVLAEQNMRASAKLTVEVAISESLGDLTPATELALYRVIQEALNNVVKHSGARQCRIEIIATDSDRGVHLAISDNGVGIPIRAVQRAGQGIGMESMRERVEEIGGRFSARRMDASGGTMIDVFVDR